MCVMSACVSMKQSIGISGLSVWVMCIRRQIADSAGPGGSGSSLQCIKCSVACYITFVGLPHFIQNNLEHQGDMRHPLFNCQHSAGQAKCLPMGKKEERENLSASCIMLQSAVHITVNHPLA